MKPADRPRFAALMSQASETYNRPLTEATLTLWWNLLAEHAIEDFERAMHAHMVEPERGRYMPLPADIVRIIEGSGGDRAALAWTKVREAIRSIGPYRSVVFDDPLIHRVLEDMGGWIQFGAMTTDEAPFRGKDFADRYKGYAMRRQVPAYLPQLEGEFDLANRKGHPEAVLPPILVGDVQRALAVRDGGSAARLEITKIDASALALPVKSSRLDNAA